MKIKLHLFLAALAAAVSFQLSAQVSGIQNRGCGSGVLPQNFESWLQSVQVNASARNGGGPNQTNSVFNIPVIVHVIHASGSAVNASGATTGDNLSAAQIMDQINILNKDYNGMNTDTNLIPSVFKPVQGKFQFNFCMAVVNPTGGVLAEPGIDRVSALTGWTAPPYSMSYVDATIKPATIWDPTRYMNMWVLNIGNGILGYATFPNPGTSGLTGLSGPYGSATTDGLVMLNTAFGSIGTGISGAPYNLGRTATHEIGHWLGLRHVWGDNGQCGATDYCNDTPPQKGGTASPAGCNYGCPTFPLHANTCTLSSVVNVNGDMFMNYMDYTDDACMYMFTNDQKNRAQLIMTNSPMRATLLTSTVCNLPTITNELALLFVTSPTYSQVVSCSNFINPVVNIHNSGSNVISSATFSYNVDGAGTQTVSWAGSLAPNASATVAMPQVSGLSNASHQYNVGVYLPNGVTDPNMSNNSNSQFFSVSGSFAISVSGPGSICPGGSAVLTASGGATSYTWNPGNIQSSSVSVSPASNTIYTVSGSNGSCVNSATYTLTVGAGLLVSASASVICGASSVTLSASGVSSYTWSSGTNSASIVVSPTTTTTYSVTGNNASSCTGSAAITITVTPLPNITITSSPATPICAGSSATLTVAGANTYAWNSGATSSMLVVSPSLTTVYTVTGTTAGCAATQTIAVTVSSGSIVLQITPSSPTICAGGSAMLSGSGATSYSWNTGSTGASVVVSPSVTTVYSFNGSAGSCVSSASVSVVVAPAGTLSVISSPSSGIVCLGHSATLTAVGSYSNYTWSGSPAVTGTSIVVTPTATASYTVVSAGGAPACSAGTVVTLHVSNSPVSSLGTVNSACSNPCTGVLSATTSGGSAPYTYMIGSSTYTSLPLTNLCPGLYNLQTLDANNCSATNIFSISNFASNFAATVSFTNASCDTCFNGALHANVSSGTGPYTYSWSPTGGNGATASNLAWGCYTLTVRDSVGCLTSSQGCLFLVDGLASISGNALFSLYPNPAKESITIAYEGADFDYTVYNHLGQLIIARKNNRNSATLSLQGVASGIYLVEVDNGKDKVRRKLIVE